MLGGATKFIGLSIRSITEVPILPATTVDVYQQKFNMGVMLAGDMWVRAVAAVTHGAPATYSASTGQLNPASAGVAIPGSRYLTSAGAGEMALLRLTAPAAGA